MAMKMISFKNGMHITVPDEAERGVVFGTSAGDRGSYTLEGPEETVMSLILELTRTALQESHNRARVVAFVITMISVLADGLEDEKKDH